MDTIQYKGSYGHCTGAKQHYTGGEDTMQDKHRHYTGGMDTIKREGMDNGVAPDGKKQIDAPPAR